MSRIPRSQDPRFFLPIAAILGVAALIANLGMPDRKEMTCGIPQRFPKVFAAYLKVTPVPAHSTMHSMSGVGTPLQQVTNGPDPIIVGSFCEMHACSYDHADIAFTRVSQRLMYLSVTLDEKEMFREAKSPLPIEVTNWLARVADGNAPFNACRE